MTSTITNSYEHSSARYRKINITDLIEINGHIYYISDKYISNNIGVSYENNRLYKFILASILEAEQLYNKKITNVIMCNCVIICDKIFSYLVTGKINVINLSKLEQKIINNIPSILIPKLNSNIIEKID